MIQFPRRSVTRFFIPLIDVLTLLFCIFLLMPMVKETGETQESPNTPAADLTLAQESRNAASIKEGRSESGAVARERETLARLRSEKMEVLQQRLYIRLLEIDADTGRLFYREADGVREIASQADALELIQRHQREAGNRELYYLFLFPRKLTGYPEQRQLERYDSWFKTVAHGTDNPLSER
jgi:hypothetical protein